MSSLKHYQWRTLSHQTSDVINLRTARHLEFLSSLDLDILILTAVTADAQSARVSETSTLPSTISVQAESRTGTDRA